MFLCFYILYVFLTFFFKYIIKIFMFFSKSWQLSTDCCCFLEFKKLYKFAKKIHIFSNIQYELLESAILFFVGHFFPNLFFKYFFIILGKNFKYLAQKMAEAAILFFVGHFVFQIYFLNIFFRIFGENFKSLS